MDGQSAPMERKGSRASAEPERSCVVTRAKLEPENGIRFVLDPENRVTPDLKRKLPGRGVWVGVSKALVAQAIKKGAFSRGFKTQAIASADLPDLVEQLLLRDALQALSLANKAGLVTTGFAKIESAVAGGNILALIHAEDGGADGKRKLGQSLRRKFGDERRPQIGNFVSEQLDLALGRTNVIHAAVGHGPTAKVFLASSRRLALYRGQSDEAAPDEGATLEQDVEADKALEQGFKADDTNGLGPGTHDRYE